VTARTQAEVDEFRRKREVHVVGTGVPRPVTNFEEASFPCEIRFQRVLCIMLHAATWPGAYAHAADILYAGVSLYVHAALCSLDLVAHGLVGLLAGGAPADQLRSDGLTQHGNTQKRPRAQNPPGHSWTGLPR